MRIYIRDLRRAKMCSKGTRAFFLQHNLDFQDFAKNGIEEEKLAATNDAMALQLIEVAKSGTK